MEREKGVATAPCSSCGKELAVVDRPDGAVTTEACPTCHKPPYKKDLREAAKQAEALHAARETGTDVPEENA